MRISDIYTLGLTQPSLDFVNIDTETDAAVFIDPRALIILNDAWGDEGISLIQNYFREVLSLIRQGRHEEAKKILGQLREPNETHLGWSKDKSRGHALGKDSAEGVWEALKNSRAVQTGLLQDLEDTLLMIEGIGPDIVSDITTNIIRPKLIQYTQDMCARYGIPTEPQVYSGPMWVPGVGWTSDLVELPVVNHKKVLLVPKSLARIHMEYDGDEYFQHYLLNHLQGIELSAKSSLVEVLKNKKRRVTKKALKEKYGTGKHVIESETIKYPEVLSKYQKEKEGNPQLPLSHDEVAQATSTHAPNWDKLLADLRVVSTGASSFKRYEHAVAALLEALFYPSLDYPNMQVKQHNGRKIVDLELRNVARKGFFWWLINHNGVFAPKVFIECKNYSSDPANPELDQLSGRFGVLKGHFGFLVSRKIEDKELFDARCRDTATDGRGFIIALDDDDLAKLVEEVKNGEGNQEFALLQEKYNQLIS